MKKIGDKLQVWKRGETPGDSKHLGYGEVIAISKMYFGERRSSKRAKQNTYLIQLENGKIINSIFCDCIPQKKAFEIAKKIEEDLKWVRLSLKFPAKSERKLRAYIKKEFGSSLEDQLHLILKEWIGKALGYISEIQNHS